MHQPAARRALQIYNFCFYAIWGVMMPYLPRHLAAIGLTGTEISALFATRTSVALGAAPLASYLADRHGAAHRIIQICHVGVMLATVPLLFVTSFAGALVPFALHAVAAGGMAPVLDSIALRTEGHGGFAGVRLWGSIGFGVSAGLFGLLVAVTGAPAEGPLTLLTVLGVAAAGFMTSLGLPRAANRGAAAVTPWRAAAILRDPILLLLCASGCIHWATNSPFNLFFAMHLERQGLSQWVPGACFAMAIAAEAVALRFAPLVLERARHGTVLIVCGLMTALRWLAMAGPWPPALWIALQATHALTFGLWFTASVAILTERVSDDLRASGQGIFATTVFTLGSILGIGLAGAGWDAWGGPATFRAAGACELAAVAGFMMYAWLERQGRARCPGGPVAAPLGSGGEGR